MRKVYLAGGCLWSVQYFMNTIPGVVATEAGRANGKDGISCTAIWRICRMCKSDLWWKADFGKRPDSPSVWNHWSVQRKSPGYGLWGKISYRRVQYRWTCAERSPAVYSGKTGCEPYSGGSKAAYSICPQCTGAPEPPGTSSGRQLPLQHPLEPAQKIQKRIDSR